MSAAPTMAELTTLRPASEWHEDFGDVLWWPIPDGCDGTPSEPPYCGSLLESAPTFPFEFDEETGAMYGPYVTHHLFWSPLPRVNPVKP